MRELIRQGLVVDEVHEVLSYDRKNMPWVDNFINLSIKLENQCDDPREKAYHALMREIFNNRAFMKHLFKLVSFLRRKILKIK